MVPERYTGDMRQFFEVSRLLCDVERFIGPDEIMEQYGMGFCYEKAYDGRVIKQPTASDIALTKAFYDRHHQALNRLCGLHASMLFFDLHSYSDRIIPPFARVQGRATPDLCIGTDPHFTAPQLRESVMRRFAEAGFSTAENYPYSGLYVPEDVMYGRCECDFTGIMLEFNRRAYYDEQGNTDPHRTALISKTIEQIIQDCRFCAGVR